MHAPFKQDMEPSPVSSHAAESPIKTLVSSNYLAVIGPSVMMMVLPSVVENVRLPSALTV